MGAIPITSILRSSLSFRATHGRPPFFIKKPNTVKIDSEGCQAKPWRSLVSSMYFVYILKLSNNNHYVGSTKDLKARLKKHNSGQVKSTRNKRPNKLVFFATFCNEGKAISFEKYLKSSSGTAFRKKRLI